MAQLRDTGRKIGGGERERALCLSLPDSTDLATRLLTPFWSIYERMRMTMRCIPCPGLLCQCRLCVWMRRARPRRRPLRRVVVGRNTCEVKGGGAVSDATGAELRRDGTVAPHVGARRKHAPARTLCATAGAARPGGGM